MVSPNMTSREGTANVFHYQAGGKSSIGGKKKGSTESTQQSRSTKAGLQFPVSRIHRHMKKGNLAKVRSRSLVPLNSNTD